MGIKNHLQGDQSLRGEAGTVHAALEKESKIQLKKIST
jgi:hypothetical protein